MDLRRLRFSIDSLDHTRGSSAPPFGPRKHKEWHHFVVLGRGFDLLVNFSCCDDLESGGQREIPRLVLLARLDEWDGDIENFDSREARITRGRIRFELGANRMEFRDGAFHIEATLRQRPISVRMTLEPRTQPVLVPGTPMRQGPPLHWLVVPRLQTRGMLRVGEREVCLDGAPAYHDHNWGHFLWGHDLSWEWGFVLPDDEEVPWCLTFVRLTDRARATALDQKLLVWRRERLFRGFREGEVQTEIGARSFRPRTVFKVPRPLALLAPEQAIDVPATFANHVNAGRDFLSCRSQPYDVVQVLIPSETDLGVTIFNEVSARVVVDGELGGEAVRFSGTSMMELIRHV